MQNTEVILAGAGPLFLPISTHVTLYSHRHAHYNAGLAAEVRLYRQATGAPGRCQRHCRFYCARVAGGRGENVDDATTHFELIGAI